MTEVSDGHFVACYLAQEGKQTNEEEKSRKNFPELTRKERRAIISAAFSVYGPLLLMLVGSFTLVALFLYFFLR